MGSRAGSREPKGISGFGAEPRAERFFRLRLSAQLFLTYRKIEFFRKLINQVESNVELLVRQILFPNTLLDGPENRVLGDQNFF